MRAFLRKRNSIQFLLLAVVVIAAITVAALVIFAPKPKVIPVSTGTSPSNVVDDGFVLTSPTVLVPGKAYSNSILFKKSAYSSTATGVPKIDIWLDYSSPASAGFNAAQQAQITQWLSAGKVEISYHPISFLDSQSTNGYSSYAGSAVACVANFSPSSFFAFNNALLAKQPAKGKMGLTPTQLIALAKNLGVTPTPAFQKCVQQGTYYEWLLTASARIQKNVPNSSLKSITGIPTITVNGAKYDGGLIDSAAFNTFVFAQK
jgi:protein-disulfide isomerase